MTKAGKNLLSHTSSWDFWRLVALVFCVSFTIQILIFLSLFQFTQLTVCFDIFNSPVSGQGLGISGPSPAKSTTDRSIELLKDDSTAIKTSSSMDSCSCAKTAEREETKHTNEKDSSRLPILTALQPLTFALHPFVKFNTYRVSYNTFFVVGITSAVARAFDKPVYDCQWYERGKDVITTEADMIYINCDENRMPYVPAIVNCTFPDPVGADGKGGKLRLSVSVKPKRDSKGTATVDVHEERRGEAHKFNVRLQQIDQNVSSMPYKYAYCGPPMHGKIRADWIISWLSYHLELYEGRQGKAKFFFYNVGGLTTESRELLDPFIKAGVVEIVEVFDEWRYPAHYHNQLLFINDCLQRTRYIAQWTLFHDFDEFLHITPPNSLQSVLQENKDKAWLTFASLPASIEFCSAHPDSGESLWPVERMLWVDKLPECRYTKNIPDPWICTGPLGRRKYVVNPRKVTGTGVHVVTFDTGDGGIDLNGILARVHHYHGALALNRKLCNTTVNLTAPTADLTSNLSNYSFDQSIARGITKARERLAVLLRGI